MLCCRIDGGLVRRPRPRTGSRAADAASTALFVGGPALFAALAHRLEIRCALLLTEENELMITAPMAARVTLLRQPVPLGPPLGAPGSCHDG